MILDGRATTLEKSAYATTTAMDETKWAEEISDEEHSAETIFLASAGFKAMHQPEGGDA